LLILLVASGAVSAAETALFALSRQSLHDFGRSASLLRRRAHRLMQQPKSVLMTVLITNTAVNIAIYALSFVALQSLAANHPALAGVASAGVLLSVIIFGEVVPKAMALGNAQRLAPSAAGMIWALQIVLGPLQWLLSALLVDPITRLVAPASPPPDTVDTEELQLLVEHSARAGHINSTENEMLQAIVELAEASVREVMTPRVDIEFIRAGDDPHAAYQTVKQSYRRIFPVCGRDLDDIRGLLFARDALLTTAAPTPLSVGANLSSAAYPSPSGSRAGVGADSSPPPKADSRMFGLTASLVRPVRFVPEQINLAQLVRHFHDERSHFAIVVDEYGGTAGLVTVDDVVEWIVGGLPDSEAPRTAPVTERIDDDTYRLAGDLSVRDWAERFAVDEIDRHIDTIGGLILSKLGRLPRAGDTVRIRNLTLTVEVMQKRRIERVLLRRLSNKAEAVGAAS